MRKHVCTQVINKLLLLLLKRKIHENENKWQKLLRACANVVTNTPGVQTFLLICCQFPG